MNETRSPRSCRGKSRSTGKVNLLGSGTGSVKQPARITSALGEIYPLTSIRFLAAFLVVAYHSLFFFIPSLDHPGVLKNAVSVGWLSVDLFFVLSGFILGVVYIRSRGSSRIDIRNFAAARFARIYPLYALSLAIDLPYALAKRFEPGVNGHTFKLLGLQIAAFVTMLQAWFPQIGNGWNIPSWSLSAEAFFYLLFPFLALTMWKTKHPILVCVLLFLTAAALPFANHYKFHSAFLESLFPWNPLLKLPEFLMGVVVAGRADRLPERLAPYLTVTTGGIILSIVLFSSRVPYVIWYGAGPLFAVFVMALSRSKGLIERILSTTWLVVLGRASYAIYLLHYPVLHWFSGIFRKFLGHHHIWVLGSDAVLLYCLYISIVIGISILAYHAVEVPARDCLRRIFEARTRSSVIDCSPFPLRGLSTPVSSRSIP